MYVPFISLAVWIKYSTFYVSCKHNGKIVIYLSAVDYINNLRKHIQIEAPRVRGEGLFKDLGVFGIFAYFFNDFFFKSIDLLFPEIISYRGKVSFIYFRQ